MSAADFGPFKEHIETTFWPRFLVSIRCKVRNYSSSEPPAAKTVRCTLCITFYASRFTYHVSRLSSSERQTVLVFAISITLISAILTEKKLCNNWKTYGFPVQRSPGNYWERSPTNVGGYPDRIGLRLPLPSSPALPNSPRTKFTLERNLVV